VGEHTQDVWSGGGYDSVFRCHVCGATEAKQEFITEVFVIDGKAVLVEGIPATVCVRCGEATFSRETTERIRRMLHGEAKPVRAEVLEVYTYT
jgi:HTH-type transcriptional regulator / antitoxin MqsA